MTAQDLGRRLRKIGRRIGNIARYGVGDEGRRRKKAAKAERREANFLDADRWKSAEEGVQRRYGSYEEYLEHQVGKLDRIADRLQETEQKDFAEFKRRFEGCQSLRDARSVLCLGARLGTEVKALHALGHFAVGIDLNPGDDNSYVLPGDFHALVFPDGSLDAIYCNALDHVFALDKVMGEVRRLLRSGGLFVVDLLDGYEEGFVPGEFEATMWRDRGSFIERLSELGGLTVEEVRDMGPHRRDHWTQVVLRKPGAAAETKVARPEPAAADA
jgi:SAM-dependent methyltransferase